ncbi:hypothetical protein GS584_23130 [Rhodococcus hoagii]|nr:hypothetical protein [Prescottella equi]
MNIADGTVDVVNLVSRERRTVAGGLVMPNGLARLGNGDLLTTHNLGTPASPGSRRIDPARPNGCAPTWAGRRRRDRRRSR